ncbi:MAG: hypothetical protein IJZ52_05640 [Clostridium sp.]|nr:hypothetical protein [Clostridium sp.]
MSEFDEKLSAILGDRNAMGQIMALAQSLSATKPECGEGEGEPDLDPFGAGENRDVQLLTALRPYLRPERQGKLDKTLEILQLLRLMRSARGK